MINAILSKNKLSTFVALAALSLGVFQNAHAEQVSQGNVDISNLGTHAGVTFYMNFQQPFSVTCAYGQLYCYSTDPNCKNYYAMVLTAKSTGKQLSRVDYTRDSNNVCTVGLVEVR